MDTVNGPHNNQKYIFGKLNRNYTPSKADTGHVNDGSLSAVRNDFFIPSSKPHLDDIFDSDLLDQYIKDKLVSVRAHPENPDLVIANYTQQASYGRVWDEITENCRGLIYNRDSGDVLARPWRKFYNHNQEEAPDMSTFTNIEVTDKMDGSLIVGWRDIKGNLRASTKGSFNSEMVPVAHKLLDEHGKFDLDPEWTPLFEVIYPGNRVVVDYNGRTDLVALGAVNMATGEVVGPEDDVFNDWKGSRTHVFDVDNIDDVMSMKPRDNAEGVIIRDTDTGQMVKIKQDDYVALHRAITNMSTLHVWENLKSGTVDDLIDIAPDEVYDSLKEHIDSFTKQHDTQVSEIMGKRDEILGALGLSLGQDFSREDRKNFAMEANKYDKKTSSRLFAATFSDDGLSKMIWDDIRPDPEQREYLGFAQRKNNKNQDSQDQ